MCWVQMETDIGTVCVSAGVLPQFTIVYIDSFSGHTPDSLLNKGHRNLN